MRGVVATVAGVVGLALVWTACARAQTADQAWLKYLPQHKALHVPAHVVALGRDPVEQSAAHELERGIASMRGSDADRLPARLCWEQWKS